jgi:hypothetical protein
METDMIDIQQLSIYIIAPVIDSLGFDKSVDEKLSAKRLIITTGMIESGYQYIAQLKGPALGFWQMEPFTHNDCWENYLKYNQDLALKLSVMCGTRGQGAYPFALEMLWNIKYAAAMSRIKYKRLETPYKERPPLLLPHSDDPLGHANLWVQGYNAGGKGKASKFLKAWAQIGFPGVTGDMVAAAQSKEIA